jgi:hypothetical protein
MSTEAQRLDAWSWWQAGRLRYNLALAAAGWLAYGLDLAISAGFRRLPWTDWRGAVGMTLWLGIGYLVFMAAANVAYLAGPALEAWLKPADSMRYRSSAYRLGFWGSIALPFLFPLANLALLIGGSG